MGIEVRRGAPEDLDWLIEQLRKFSQFTGGRRPLFGDEDHARSFVLNLINTHLVLISHDEGTRTGFIAGFVIPHFFNPSIRFLCESFWWVDEPYRGTRSAFMLFNAFTDWGKENADLISLSLEHHSPLKDSSLIKRGFSPYERTFVMEVS